MALPRAAPPKETSYTVEVIARIWPPSNAVGTAEQVGILRCREASQRREIICMGKGMGTIPNGKWVAIEGHWTDDAKRGQRFAVESWVYSQARSVAQQSGTEKLLIRITGVGKKLAPKLAEKGLRNLIDDPGIIALAVPEKYKMRALEEWLQLRPEAELAAVFAEIGLGPGKTRRIFDACGGVKGTWRVLRANPWSLANAVPGISFETSDKIAQRLGADMDSPQRLLHGVADLAIQMTVVRGHTLIPSSFLIKKAMEKLGQDETKIWQAVMGNDDLVRAGMEGVAPRNFHKAEEAIATILINQLPPWGGIEMNEAIIDACAIKSKLDKIQTLAIKGVNRNAVSILTGGPGTGKTTTTGTLVASCMEAGLELLLLAPTGLAARRMGQISNHPAMTIHRWVHRRDKDTFSKADLVIVDESSMIDSQLMAQLLWAMTSVSKRICLVGDSHQLPSISPGRPFGDLIESGLIPTFKLEKIWRQEGESVIPLVAKMIREGKYPDRGLELFDQVPIENQKGLVSVDHGYKFYEFDTALEVEEVASRESLLMAGKYGQDNIAVLAPMYDKEAGITRLGSFLQRSLNPGRKPHEILSGKGGLWKVGDPTMHIGNNYPVGLTHAMRGRVISVDLEAESLSIEWEDGAIRHHDAPDGEVDRVILSYALSWHRSQGSEFPAVTVVLANSHQRILSVEALYTAITRAKRELVIVAEKGAVDLALKVRATSRRTALHEILLEMR